MNENDRVLIRFEIITSFMKIVLFSIMGQSTANCHLWSLSPLLNCLTTSMKMLRNVKLLFFITSWHWIRSSSGKEHNFEQSRTLKYFLFKWIFLLYVDINFLRNVYLALKTEIIEIKRFSWPWSNFSICRPNGRLSFPFRKQSHRSIRSQLPHAYLHRQEIYKLYHLRQHSIEKYEMTREYLLTIGKVCKFRDHFVNKSRFLWLKVRID